MTVELIPLPADDQLTIVARKGDRWVATQIDRDQFETMGFEGIGRTFGQAVEVLDEWLDGDRVSAPNMAKVTASGENKPRARPPWVKLRLKSCVERWAGCADGEYNPSCCRFPKDCSATVYPDDIDPKYLEEDTWGKRDG